MLRKTILVIGVVTTLAACGGGPSSGFTNAQAVANKAHMTHCAPPARGFPALGAADEVVCDQGEALYFASSDGESQWEQLPDGLASARRLEGNGFAIDCLTLSWCRGAQRIMGGTIR